MIGKRTRIVDLHEAGKPDGCCAECGPHGNRGWVDLSIWRRHVVPCLECTSRADLVAHREADERAAEIIKDVYAEGCEPLEAEHAVEPIGDDPRARRVRVSLTYRHAKAGVTAHCDAVAVDAVALALSTWTMVNWARLDRFSGPVTAPPPTLRQWAERLHKLGWHPGQTADRAVELLDANSKVLSATKAALDAYYAGQVAPVMGVP